MHSRKYQRRFANHSSLTGHLPMKSATNRLQCPLSSLHRCSV
jgi:hypothetical protein